MWRCPRIAFANRHFHVPVHYDSMILSKSEMDRDPTYEWFGKHGLRYYVAGWIGDTESHRAYMSLQRSRRQGHVEPEDAAQFALVLKHMAQALSLASKLGTLEQRSCVNLAVMDSLPHALIALDAAGKVLLMNSKAQRLLATRDALVVFDGHLECRRASDQGSFARVVSAALQLGSTSSRGGWTRIHRSSGRRDLFALVAPLEAREDLFASYQPKALVVISDPTEGISTDERGLQELFALTPAEARLALSLCNGHSIGSAAALLRIRPETARSELKSVFRKVGVNRQQDMVRILCVTRCVSWNFQ